MRHTINTNIGDITVFLSYQPIKADDKVLERFATAINESNTLDEAAIEKALYETTRVNGGSGLRLTFSLSRMEIHVSGY